MLAPSRWKKFSSYIIGWLTSLAWIATVATESLFAGLMIQGLIILDHPDYDDKPYQGTLFAWLVCAVAVFVNWGIPNLLPKFEIFILVFHIAGFIAVLATLLAMTSPKKSAEFVFTTSLNEGAWPTLGLSYCVGFLGNVATFVGADASVHMAEEIENSAVNVPRAIIGAMVINGLIGLAMMLTTLFCLGDVDTVLDSATGYPFIQIFYDSTKSTAGATVLGAVVLFLTWACAIGITTTASRMTWSFARDRGVPFSHWLMKVGGHTRVPYVALLAVVGLSCLLTLIYIGSYTAFNDVISLTITGFYGSYLIPASLLLYHRLKNHIQPHGTQISRNEIVDRSHSIIQETKDDSQAAATTSSTTIELVSQAPLIWGPWHLPGWIGILNNVYACIYMIFVVFWSFWPPDFPANYVSMNYSIVVTGGVILLSIVWYHIRGKREYQGPLIDEEVREILHLTV